MSGRGRTGVAQDERKPKEKLQKIADKRGDRATEKTEV